MTTSLQLLDSLLLSLDKELNARENTLQEEDESESEEWSEESYIEWTWQWFDYMEDDELLQFKKSMPLSIQMIIDWVRSIMLENESMDMDFDLFENYVIHSYHENTGDTQALKKLYFPFFPKHGIDHFGYDHGKEVRFAKVLGGGCDSPLRVLFKFARIYMDKKIMIQSLKMLKLIFKHDIIDIHDICGCGSFAQYIYEQIRELTVITTTCQDYLDDEGYEALIDLFMVYLENEFEESQAIVTLSDTKWNDNADNAHEWHVSDKLKKLYKEGIHLEVLFKANPIILRKLFFRGVLPFQFVRKVHSKHNDDAEVKTDTTIIRPSSRMTEDDKSIFSALLKDQNVWKLESDRNKVQKWTKNKVMDQFEVLSPLVLKPFVENAEAVMEDYLYRCLSDEQFIENDNLCHQISSVISSFIFVDYRIFYDQEIETDLNVKSLIFLCYLKRFTVDESFSIWFEQLYSDEIFINYLVKNYAIMVSKYIAENYTSNFYVLHGIINGYNKQNEKDEKFPIKNGIDVILNAMMTTSTIEYNYTQFIKLLRYCKVTYKDEFQFKCINPERIPLIQALIRFSNDDYNRDIANKIVDAIFEVFTDKDTFDTIVMDIIKRKDNEDWFKLIIEKYSDNYTIQEICKILNKLPDSDSSYIQYMDKEDIKEWAQYLDKIKQSCLEIKYIDDKDKDVLERTISEIMQSLERMCDTD